MGTDIQIKMFDDRIVVESPGILPGMVRLNNMRTVHFSRNPKIAVFLHEYEYVQEFGEGVDRMCREMESAPQISRQILINTLQIPGRTVDRAIASLISKNLIERIGSKKTGHWQIKE